MLSSKTDRGSDATAETGSSPARGTATGPVAALFDAVAIAVFVLIGRASHEEGYALTSVLHTLWPFLAAVENGPLAATQFHPEKSAAHGLALYRNFLRWKP